MTEQNDVNVMDKPLDDRAFAKRRDSFDSSPSGNGVRSRVSTKMTVERGNTIKRVRTYSERKYAD